MRIGMMLLVFGALAVAPVAGSAQARDAVVFQRVESPASLAGAPSGAAGERSWISRHPVQAGAIAGATLGLVAALIEIQRDSYCQDPDMIPCETGIPIAVGIGAGLGALIGLAATAEPKR